MLVSTTPFALPSVDLPASALELRQEVRDFLSEEEAAGAFTPRCDSWLAGFSPEFSKKLGQRGWLGVTWPEQYGGAGRSPLDRFIINEELLARGTPVAAHWIADRQIGPSLLRYGSEEQRRSFLPRIARGELYFSLGMSESDSGSDLASVRTRAVPEGDGWRLNGSKVWTSNAHRSHYMVALCRTEPLDPARRHDGLTQFIVDLHAPGVTVSPIELLDGEHHFNQVVLDEVAVPDSMLLGQPGAGWTQITSELAFERGGSERFLSTFPLMRAVVTEAGDSDDARAEVGRLVSQLATLREMSIRLAAALSRDSTPDVEAALVKDLGTRFENEVIDVARRLNPDVSPSLSGPPLARYLAEAILHAPGFTLRGGTNEILRGIVARELGLR